MLIIFDLDDTLIQTSRFITPWRFKKVLENLNLDPAIKSDIFDSLQTRHLEFESSQEAIEQIFKSYKIDEINLNQASYFLNSYDEQIPVYLFSGVKELLQNLKLNYSLALVTKGKAELQKLKILKAGLEDDFFNQIVIVESGNKKEAFSQAAQGEESKNVFVVGDRVFADLQPAKALGFKTCLVRQGRGEFQKIFPDFVDYIIQDVTELENLLKSIQ